MCRVTIVTMSIFLILFLRLSMSKSKWDRIIPHPSQRPHDSLSMQGNLEEMTWIKKGSRLPLAMVRKQSIQKCFGIQTAIAGGQALLFLSKLHHLTEKALIIDLSANCIHSLIILGSSVVGERVDSGNNIQFALESLQLFYSMFFNQSDLIEYVHHEAW